MPSPTQSTGQEPPSEPSSRRWRWITPLRLTGLLVISLALLAFVGARMMSDRRFDQGMAALRVHRFRLADEQLKLAGDIDRRGGEVALMRCRVAWVDGDRETSLAHLQAAENQGLDPSRVEQERTLIQIRGDSAAAMRPQLPAMLRGTSPQDGPAILEAFTAGFLARANVGQASEILDYWQQADADDPRIYYWRGVLRRAFGEPSDAVEQFETALRLAPEMTPARLALADVLRSADFYSDALAQYEQIVRRGKETPMPSSGWRSAN